MITGPIQEMEQAQEAYVAFDDGQKYDDAQALKTKIHDFDTMKGNPDYLIALFMTMLMLGDPQSSKPAERCSVTHNLENSLNEASCEINYSSAYRDAVTEISNQFQAAKNDPSAGNTQTIVDDVNAMDQYMNNGWGPHAPAIFQNTGTTFTDAEAGLTALVKAIGTGPGQYKDMNALWVASSKKGDQTASALIQGFQTGTQTLNSAVGVQSNVFQTQLQAMEGDLKSFYSTISAMIKSYNATKNNAIQRQTTS